MQTGTNVHGIDVARVREIEEPTNTRGRSPLWSC